MPPTLTADERLARLEARVAELEKSLGVTPSALPAHPTGAEWVRRSRPSPEQVAAEMAEFWKRIGADIPPVGAEALQQMQVDEGADTSIPWARIECERMREE